MMLSVCLVSHQWTGVQSVVYLIQFDQYTRGAEVGGLRLLIFFDYQHQASQ